MKIYFDVCCLNRPFDDQTQQNIHLESEAVITILSNIQKGKWIMIGSAFLDWEISKIPEMERFHKVRYLYSMAKLKITTDNFIETRQPVIEEMGFGTIDAFHIAAAEKAKADILITTDYDILKKYDLQRNLINVRIQNPVQFLMEVNIP